MCSDSKTALTGGFFFPTKLLLSILASVTCIVYSSGLSGPFLLDDGNLKILAEIGGVDDLRGLWRYLTSDLSGLLGRPLSNLTFLSNYSSWPTSPFPFKSTNLIIHTITGGLLYWLTCKIVSPMKSMQHTNWAAFFVTAYWMLNPFNVSTTLYVIQRMTMLSTLFVIAGLILYIHGRKLQAEGNNKGYWLMSSAIIFGTSLSILSKENGALLPLLTLIVEYTAIRHHHKLPAPQRTWSLIFLWLPALVLLLLIAYFGTPSSYSQRAFTLSERLLTECRVLIEYLYYWFNPFAISRGVLASDYPLSTGFLTPWQTLPALLVIVGALLWAIWQRKRRPIAALAILFFLAGHLMESTIIPLEIYFEHRNYLPTIFLVLPMFLWVKQKTAISSKGVVPLLIIFFLSTQIVQTFRLTSIWGDDLKLAAWWSYHNPTDSRAQSFYANTLSSVGKPRQALLALRKAIKLKPEFSHYYLQALVEECKLNAITTDRLSQLKRQLSSYPLYKTSYPLLNNVLGVARLNKCSGFSPTEALVLVDTLVNHSASRKDRDGHGQLMHFHGLALILNKQPEKAIESFKESLKYKPDVQAGLEQVALLGSHRYYELGLSWLTHVSNMPRPKSIREIGRSWDFDVEVEHLRTQLNKYISKSTSQRNE